MHTLLAYVCQLNTVARVTVEFVARHVKRFSTSGVEQDFPRRCALHSCPKYNDPFRHHPLTCYPVLDSACLLAPKPLKFSPSSKKWIRPKIICYVTLGCNSASSQETWIGKIFYVALGVHLHPLQPLLRLFVRL